MNDAKETKQSIQEIIAKEFGFSDLTDGKQQQLIEKMTESVIKRILVDAYTKLSESDRQTFEKMMEDIEDIDPNNIDEFLREKLTNYDAVVSDAVSDLKKHLGGAN